MKKISILALLIALPFGFIVHAEDVFIQKFIEARTLLHSGYDHWNESEMQQAVAQFQRLLDLERESWLVNYYIGLGEYRLAVFYMEKDKNLSGQYFNHAIDHLKMSISENDTFPECYALVSSCYGNKIGLTPWKAMFLGPKSNAEMDRAMTRGPDNPRVWMLKGIGSKYSPKTFGGGLDKALEELQKSVQLFEKEKVENPLYPCWGHDQAWGWIGMIYLEQNQPEAAREAFEKSLQINPDYGWIKYDLLPKVQENKNETAD